MLLILALPNKYPYLLVLLALGMGPEKSPLSCRDHRTQLGKQLVGTWVWPQKSLPEDALHTDTTADNPSAEITGSYTARCKGKSDPAAGACCSDSKADSTGGSLPPRYLGPCLWGHHGPLPVVAKAFCQQFPGLEKRLLSPSVGIRGDYYTCKTFHLRGTSPSAKHFHTH